MWQERFIEICQEKVGLSEMRGGVTMFQKVSSKMRITNFCGTLVCKRTMKLRDRSCQIIDVAILEDGRVREKEDEKIE